MPRRIIPVLLCISIASLASDLKYSQKTRDATGEHGQITLYFQGQRVRIDHRNEYGYDWKDGRPETIAYGPRMATIYQCDMHRILQLDSEHHQYTTTELDRSGVPVSGPESNPARSSGAKVRVTVESRDTGESKQMFGQTARRFVTIRKRFPAPGACSAAQESTEDGWYIDVPRPPTGCSESSQPAVRMVAVAEKDDCLDDLEVQHTGPVPPPFPVELTVTTRIPGAAANNTHWTTELVTDLSRLPLDPQIFDLPTGYKHVDKLDDSPNLPWLLRGRLMWQSVKTTVWSWTPWGK
jgi:hypothetical protein